MKKAGFVAFGVILGIVLLILLFTGIKNNPKGGVSSTTPPVSSNTSAQSVQTVKYDRGFYLVRDTSLLSYTAPILTVGGTVSEKCIYLDGNQIIYYLKISLDDLNSSSVNYYCTSEVYDSISEGTRLSVTYQKVTESAFSVCSVTAEK